MVACRGRNHAAFQCLRRQLQQCVQRPAFLIGGRKLQIFKLQVNICAGQLRQSLAVQSRSRNNRIPNAVMRHTNVIQGQLFAGGFIGHRRCPLTHLAQ